MSEEVKSLITPEMRLGHFPKVFEKGLANDSGDSFYEIDMLFSPEAQQTPAFAAMKAAAAAAVADKWPKDKPETIRSPFRKASAKKRQKDNTSHYPEEEFPGYVLVSAKSKKQPGVVDSRVQPIIDSSEVYGGCFARVSVHPFAYLVKGNAGVSFWMNNMQITKKGEPLGAGSGPPASAEFTPIAEGAGAGVENMFDDDIPF